MTRFAAILAVLATPAFPDAPVVEKVETTALASGDWRFDVTLSHPDTGWDHYADAWSVVTYEGRDLAVRALAHPHETEQPFTRSLVVKGPIPEVVYIGTKCSVDDWSDELFEVTLK